MHCIKNNIKNPPLNEIGRPLVDSEGKLHMGDLNSQRDWGYAKEYVEAMWLMMQNETPKDYIIGTNTNHSVRDVCEKAFSVAGLDWKNHVITNNDLLRPTEIKELKGDYSLAKKELGWEPRTNFDQLIQIMVEADLKRFI